MKFKSFIETNLPEAFSIIDVRKRIHKDPSTSIGHHENGRFLQTQKIVMSQTGLYEVIYEAYELSCIDRGHVGFKCREGFHRADTCGRLMEEFCNSIKREDGTRVFNAKHFSFSEAYGRKGVENLMYQVHEWVDDPWVRMPSSDVRSRDVYGYEAMLASRQRFRENLIELHDDIKKSME